MRDENPQISFTDLLSQSIKEILDADDRFQPFASRIRKLQIRYVEEQFQLAVLGQFKRGKSTLLNALLGAPLLPSALIPVTSIPVFLRSGKRPEVRVTFLDGRSEVADQDALALFVTEEKNPNNQKQVREVEVSYPASVLEAGITLIDTPGIGSTFKHNTQTTLDFLPQCDAALFLVSADPPITEVEVQFLKEVKQQVARIYFVLNKVDYLSPDESDQATQFLKRVIHEHLKEEPQVFRVSARRGLESRLKEDSELWKSSGLETLERELLRFAREEKKLVLAAALAEKARAVLGELLFEANVELRSLELPIEDLNQRLSFFNERLVNIEQDKQTAQDVLQGEHRRLTSLIETTCQEMRGKISERLQSWAYRFFVQAKEEKDVSGAEEKFRTEMLELMLALLNQSLSGFMEELRTRIKKAVESQTQTAQSLFDALSQAAADIFEIKFEPLGRASVVPLPERVAWNTEIWSSSIVAPSAQTLEKIVPKSLRVRMMEKRLTEEMLGLVIQNIEKIRWRALQRWDEIFRGFSTEVEERYQVLRRGIQDSITAAANRRSNMGGTVKSAQSSLRRLKSEMELVQKQLTKVSEGFGVDHGTTGG